MARGPVPRPWVYEITPDRRCQDERSQLNTLKGYDNDLISSIYRF
jgi:hypothetical protein